MDPKEIGAILEAGGPSPPEGGKGRQWHRTVEEDRHHGMPQNTGEGSSQHQATFMHRVSVIVHCVVITTPTTITGIVFYCIFCYRKINHLGVKNHLLHPLVYGKLCRAQFIHNKSF